MTASFARSPARRRAISTETWRDACAAPIPTVAPLRARTMAFERTWRTARQANSRSVSSSSVGPPLGDDLEPAAVEPEVVLRLDEQPAGDPLEVEAGDAVVAHPLDRVGRDGEQLESGLLLEHPERGLAEAGRDDGLVRVGRDLAGRRAVELAVDRHDPAERGDRVGLERMPVRLDELVVRGQPDRVGVLDDRDRRRGVVARDPIRRVEVEQVVERRPIALDLRRVGERAAPVRRLAVERRPLVRVLAVAQVVDLLEDHREPAREDVARRSG